MTLASPVTHTAALIATLEDATVVVAERDGSKKVKHGWQGSPGRSSFIGYAVVDDLDITFDGSLGCPDDDAEFRWQVTCVGSTRAECAAVVHAVNTAVIGASLTVVGRSVLRVRADGGFGIRRDESINPPLYIATPRYAAWST